MGAKWKILTLCSNCAEHNSDIRLTSISQALLPPNATSLIQPVDQPIIAKFKKQQIAYFMPCSEYNQKQNHENSNTAGQKPLLLGSLHMQKRSLELN